MTIIITGVCGFVGNVVAQQLVLHQSDIRIVGLDSLVRKGSEINVEPLRKMGIEVIIGDIRNSSVVEALPKADWVIDCAANPSVLAGIDGKTSPKELLDHNLLGTIHLLEYCRRHGAGFLLLSTSRVYSIDPLAKLDVIEEREGFRPTGDGWGITERGVSEVFSTEPPLSLYGTSKRCSELLAMEYGSTFDFPVRINRCGVLAGAGQFGKADQGIFSFWIHSWAQRRALKYIGFSGSGFQVRDCLHPRDLTELLVRQMEKPGHLAPVILNFAGGPANAMSLAQLSSWCVNRLGKHEVERDPKPRPFDIPWMVLDSSAAKLAWNWEPKTSIIDILEEIAIHSETSPYWLDLVA